MIIAFQYPHKVGSVCSPPCTQCHEFPGYVGYMADADGYCPTKSMFIVREANCGEWLEWCKQNPGKLVPLIDPDDHYYEVEIRLD